MILCPFCMEKEYRHAFRKHPIIVTYCEDKECEEKASNRFEEIIDRVEENGD